MKKILKKFFLVILICIFILTIALARQYTADRFKEQQIKEVFLQEYPKATRVSVVFRRRPLEWFEIHFTAMEITPDQAIKLIRALSDYDKYYPVPDNWSMRN